uniref:DM domain-containing protein n=1 Tax=Tetranychus urticae TaxID=32264 RepID=T1KGB0_TETUR
MYKINFSIDSLLGLDAVSKENEKNRCRLEDKRGERLSSGEGRRSPDITGDTGDDISANNGSGYEDGEGSVNISNNNNNNNNNTSEEGRDGGGVFMVTTDSVIHISEDLKSCSIVGRPLSSPLGNLDSYRSPMSSHHPLTSPAASIVKSEESQMSVVSNESQSAGDTSSSIALVSTDSLVVIGSNAIGGNSSGLGGGGGDDGLGSSSVSRGSPIGGKGLTKEKTKRKEKEGPYCAKCKVHFEYFEVKNHKDKCARRYCQCRICKLIDKGKNLRGKKKKANPSEANSSSQQQLSEV